MAANLLPERKAELDAKSTTVIPQVDVAATLAAARLALGETAVTSTPVDANYDPANSSTNKFYNVPPAQ